MHLAYLQTLQKLSHDALIYDARAQTTSHREVEMNTLLEITMDEFRQLHPMLFSDLEVVDIYCNTGWLGILLSLCDTFQRYLSRYPDVEPVSFG